MPKTVLEYQERNRFIKAVEILHIGDNYAILDCNGINIGISKKNLSPKYIR